MDGIKNAYSHGETVDDETRLITYAQHPKLEEYRERAERDVNTKSNDNGKVVGVYLRSLDKTFLGAFPVKSVEEGRVKQVLAWLKEVDRTDASGGSAGACFRIHDSNNSFGTEAPISKNASSSPAPVTAQEAAATVVGTSLSRYSTGGGGDHLAEGASHLALVTRDKGRISVPTVKASKSPSSGAGSSSDLAAHLRETVPSGGKPAFPVLVASRQVNLLSNASAAVPGIPCSPYSRGGHGSFAEDASHIARETPRYSRTTTSSRIREATLLDGTSSSFVPNPKSRSTTGSRDPPSFPAPVGEQQAVAAIVGVPSSRYSLDERGGPVAEGASHSGLHALGDDPPSALMSTEPATLSVRPSEVARAPSLSEGKTVAPQPATPAQETAADNDAVPCQGYRLRPGEACEPRFRQDRTTPTAEEEAALLEMHHKESDEISEAMWAMNTAHEQRIKAAMKRTHERHIRKEAWLRRRERAEAREMAKAAEATRPRARICHWGELGCEDEGQAQPRDDRSETSNPIADSSCPKPVSKRPRG